MQHNTIYNMPCEEGLQLLPDESIDCFVTSPPYGGLRNYQGFKWDFHKVAAEMYRTLKPGGVICWNTGDEVIKTKAMLYPERQAVHFADIGLTLWDRIIWQKNGVPSPTPKRYYNTTEPIYIFSKGIPSRLNLIEDRINVSVGKTEITHKRTCKEHRERSNRPNYVTQQYGRRTNVWHYKSQKNDSGHPAIMNVKLAYDLIRSYTNEQDLVCDPFSGSGTTIEAAERLNRRWIAFEIAKQYAEMSQKRVEKMNFDLFSNCK